MRFVTVRDFRIRPGTVWSNLDKNEAIVITSKGKPIALLTAVSDATFDETLTALRRTKAELAVSRMRKTAPKKKVTPKDIEAEITVARKARK